MKLSRWSWVVFLGVLVAGGAFADGRRDVQALRADAAKGDIAAQLSLAGAYMFGDGVARPGARRKWSPRRRPGSAAQMSLGMVYVGGQGVPQDEKEAVKWFRLAGEQGLVEAQAMLAGIYATGKGVPQDETEAVKWLRLAAAKGDAGSQNNLGGQGFEDITTLPAPVGSPRTTVHRSGSTTGSRATTPSSRPRPTRPPLTLPPTSTAHRAPATISTWMLTPEIDLSAIDT